MLASTVTTMQDNSAHGEDSFLSKDLGGGEFLDVVLDLSLIHISEPTRPY